MIKPYFETKLGKLYHGDCLEIMPELEPVDLVLTDPPYGTIACEWDSVIQIEPMWKQLKRIIREGGNGAIVLMSAQPFTSVLISSNLTMFKYEWVWEKTRASGFINCKNRPISKHENICVFSLGTVANKSKRLMKYNPQGLIYAPYHKKRLQPMTAKPGGFLGMRPSHVAEYDVEYINYPKSVIKVANPNTGLLHPTQKPVVLMEYLIKTYSNKNETVLDFCVGSGTTAIACERLNRKWIGIEIEEKYCEIAVKRIEENLTVMERIERSEKGITKKTGLLF